MKIVFFLQLNLKKNIVGFKSLHPKSKCLCTFLATSLDYFSIDVVGCVPVTHCVTVAFVVVVYPFTVAVVLYGSVSGWHAGGVLNDSDFVTFFQ